MVQERDKEAFKYTDLGKLCKHLGVCYKEKCNKNGELYLEATMPKMVKDIIKLMELYKGEPIKKQDIPRTQRECTYKTKDPIVQEKWYGSLGTLYRIIGENWRNMLGT
jgi:hypothetical protein